MNELDKNANDKIFINYVLKYLKVYLNHSNISTINIPMQEHELSQFYCLPTNTQK